MRLGRLRLQTNIVLLHIHVHIPLKGENLSFSCALLERQPRTSPAARQPGAFRDPSISSLFCTVRHHALIATRRMTRQGSQAVQGLGRGPTSRAIGSPALLMTVRGQIAKPRRETGARSPEDLRPTRAVRRRSEGRARRPPACRNSGSAIAAEES